MGKLILCILPDLRPERGAVGGACTGHPVGGALVLFDDGGGLTWMFNLSNGGPETGGIQSEHSGPQTNCIQSWTPRE